jgi:tetratricopeptide (TPR) repeat protein
MELGPAQIEVSLAGRWRRSCLLAGTGLLGLLLAAEAALAGFVLSFDAPSQARWLLRFDSSDPQLQYRLGRTYEDSDREQSVYYLRRATALSPTNRRYWAHLGDDCESLGDTQCADEAWHRLLALCPMVPLYHWTAAQSYLRANRLDDSFAQVRTLVQLDPADYAVASWNSLRAVTDPDRIFDRVARFCSPAVQAGYVDFLGERGEADAAYRIWKRVAASSGGFPLSSAQPYLERLIADHRFAEATGVWQDLERLGIVKVAGSDAGENAVFNGDFEQYPLNAGFDWRWSNRLNYLAVDFSATAAYHGTRCLRIDFAASRNLEYEPVYQIVPVEPKHTYRLTAYVRSDSIASDTGPFLRITDTEQPPAFRDALSGTTVGTTSWHPVHAYFATGPQTQGVRLSVWRPLGRVFPTEISGSFWLDEVSIEMVDPEAVNRQ